MNYKMSILLALQIFKSLSQSHAGYTLKNSYAGTTFFDGMTFDTTDYNNGMVQYTDQNKATSSKLAYVSGDNKVHITSDSSSMLTGNQKRAGIKLISKDTWDKGLFIFDLDHMPAGCGTWPVSEIDNVLNNSI